MSKIRYNNVAKFSTLKEMMEMAVREAGDKIAFKYRKGEEVISITYREFQQDTFAVGTALVEQGMGNTHIAIVGDNSYNYATVFLTALKSSGVAVPIDKELPADEFINVVNDSDSTVIFYDKKHEAMLKDHESEMPNIKLFIGFERENDEGKFLSYEKFKANGLKSYNDGNKKYEDLTSNEYELKMLVYTSGTTGMAKGVMLSEHNLVHAVIDGPTVVELGTRTLSVLPYHHTYEAVCGLLVELHIHATICMNESLKTVAKNLQFYKPDFIYLVPAFAEVFYKKIWANAEKTGKAGFLKVMIKVSNFLRKLGIDLRKKLFKSIHEVFGGELKEIICGGAPLRPELAEFFQSIGIELLNGYGITECSPLVSVNQLWFNDPHTVGIEIPSVKVRIEEPDNDGIGEICVKGDVVMLGYYKKPDATAEVLKDGWFHTGDYGKLNEKRQVVITGRKKNLIVLENGKNVFPEEVELYISAISYITDVVVYGVKDDNGSEVGLCAEVLLNDERVQELGIENPEIAVKDDIAKVCAKLPIYKRVTKVVVRKEAFEKTTTNKIKRAKVGQSQK